MKFSSARSLTKAKRTITKAHHIPHTRENQKTKLAAAHCRLAMQDNISRPRLQFHLNAAITILQSVDSQSKESVSRLTHVYFMRAEAYETFSCFNRAALDYLRIIHLFEKKSPEDDEDRLIYAQSCIAIADMLINQDFDLEDPLFQDITHIDNALSYIDRALSILGLIKNSNTKTWISIAYAYQTAGIALSKLDTDIANEIYHQALEIAFDLEGEISCALLADIYSCIGLLHHTSPHEKPLNLIEEFDYGMIYFSLSMLFTPSTHETIFGDPLSFHDILDVLHQLSTTTHIPLDEQVLIDVIDAFAIACQKGFEKSLSNKVLQSAILNEDGYQSIMAKLEKLLLEYTHYISPTTRLLSYHVISNKHIEIDLYPLLHPAPNNVYHIFG